MKILSIGLERKLFSENSKAQQRIFGYGKLFERFDLIILSGRGYQSVEFENVLIVPTNSLGKFFYLIDACLLGKKMIKKYKYEIISAQDPFEMGFLAWLLAKKYGLKLQIQIHGDYFSSSYWRRENILNSIRYYLGKWLIKKAGGVRVVSNRIKESLIKSGVTPEKIIVAPIYAPVSNKNLAVRNKKYNDKFIFLTVGRLVAVKNIILQIRAMEKIIESNPKTELWIVGDGPEREKLEMESKKLKVDNSVKFFGWKDNLEEFYEQANAFLLTSNYEGWGMVIIEAASFGLSIIMTDVGCAGEIIKNEESGIVIKVGDREALVESMKKLIEDVNFSKKISERAKKETLSLPNQEQNLNLYKQSFNNLI